MADIIGGLKDEWRTVGRSREACEATRRLDVKYPDLDLGYMMDLCDVVSLCDQGHRRTSLERAEIVNAMLKEAIDPIIRRAMTQTLIPGITQVCRDMQFGKGIIDDAGDCMAIALSTLAEVLSDWAGQSRQYAAPDILSAVRCRLMRSLMKEKATARRSSGYPCEVVAPEGSTLLSRLEALAGGESDRLVQLMYRCIFDGRSVSQLAMAEGVNPYGLRRELQEFALSHVL